MSKPVPVEVAGLVPPWKAFLSNRKQKVYYYNMKTGETSWQMPSNPSVAPRKAKKHNRRKNKSKSQFNSVANEVRTVPNEASAVASELSTVANVSAVVAEPSCSSVAPADLVEMMDVDMCSADDEEEVGEAEPMEVDEVVEQVKQFRRQNFFLPGITTVDSDKDRGSSTVKGRSVARERDVGPVVVFDTSCLLDDVTLVPQCFAQSLSVMIPYTVLRELDGLKKGREDLRQTAGRVSTTIYDALKSGCELLLLEASYEARAMLDEFSCEQNDDVIMKCAVTTAKKYSNSTVIFATDDKILAVKAGAHGLRSMDHKELRCWLDKVASEKAARKSSASGLSKLTANNRCKTLKKGIGGSNQKAPMSSAAACTMKINPARKLVAKSAAESEAKKATFRKVASNRVEKVSKKAKKKMLQAELKADVLSKLPKNSEFVLPKKRSSKKSEYLTVLDEAIRTNISLNNAPQGRYFAIFLRTLSNVVNAVEKRRSEGADDEELKKNIAKLIGAMNACCANKVGSLLELVDVVSSMRDLYIQDGLDVFGAKTPFDKEALKAEFVEWRPALLAEINQFRSFLCDTPCEASSSDVPIL